MHNARHKGCRRIAGLKFSPGQRTHRRRLRLRLDKKQNGIVAVYDLGGGTFDIPFSNCTKESSKSSPQR